MIGSGAILGTYGGATTYRMYRDRKDYRPAIEDWIWNAALPLLCYLALIAAGVCALRQSAAALYIIGASALALLFIGIHNAWDIAVWVTVERPAVQEQHKKADNAAASATPAATAGHAAGDPQD
jgi:hypothetical protein